MCVEDGSKMKKNNRISFRVGCLIGGILLLAILISFLPGFYMRHFAKPEAYFEYVMERAVNKSGDLGENLYEKLLERIYIEEYSGQTMLSFSADHGIQNLLSLLLMQDLSWIWENKATVTYTYEPSYLTIDAEISDGAQNYWKAEIIYDMIYGAYMVGWVQNGDEHIEREIQGMGNVSVFNALKKFAEEYPDAEVIKAIYRKYAMLIVESVGEVKRDTAFLEVDGVRQKCTTLTFTLCTDEIANILNVVMEEMETDDIVSEAIKKWVYEIGQNAIKSGDINVVIYVGAMHRIAGITVESAQNRFYFAMPVSGFSYGLEIGAVYGEKSVVLCGTGHLSPVRTGGKYRVCYNGEEYIFLGLEDIDLMCLRRGRIEGSFTIGFSQAVYERVLPVTKNMAMNLEDYELCLKIDDKEKWMWILASVRNAERVFLQIDIMHEKPVY